MVKLRGKMYRLYGGININTNSARRSNCWRVEFEETSLLSDVHRAWILLQFPHVRDINISQVCSHDGYFQTAPLIDGTNNKHPKRGAENIFGVLNSWRRNSKALPSSIPLKFFKWINQTSHISVPLRREWLGFDVYLHPTQSLMNKNDSSETKHVSAPFSAWMMMTSHHQVVFSRLMMLPRNGAHSIKTDDGHFPVTSSFINEPITVGVFRF